MTGAWTTGALPRRPWTAARSRQAGRRSSSSAVYAAGTLIAQEAGATATRLEGGPMDPLHAGSVFITNGVCHSVLSELQQ